MTDLPPTRTSAMPADDHKRRQLLADLHAVVVALDLRAVHPERAREPAIAADASALRSEALRRIDALEDRDLQGPDSGH